MKSVEDNLKLLKHNKNDDDDDDDDDEDDDQNSEQCKEKSQKIGENVAKITAATTTPTTAVSDEQHRHRILPNPNLLHGRKSKDIDEWLDEMKFYAWKSRGIPESRRKELWLTLAEKYFRSKCINWKERRSSTIYIEDRDMEDQIIKDLHRTGSAFCSGPNSIINQGKLKHLLLEYAQWNPKVGYCQGFNVLGAFILQIMEKEQENSLKIMVYLLEGLLPAGYYSESLIGLQIDMAVFRQLMFEQLPKLATHLQNLEKGQGFDEPPLTNLFTMQWFLTIFCTCLSMPSLLRVWDLIFLEGNEVIFRTSLAIWSIMERYVTKMNSIDDFYGNMGILFQRLCSGSMCDPADLIRMISRFKPITNLHVLRVRHKQHSERNKKANKSNQKSSQPVSFQSKAVVDSKSVRDSNKKVNITNIDISVFKKQYEKLKRRPSFELNTASLRKKSFDASKTANFTVNKFWSNNINNNSIPNNNKSNSSINNKKKLQHSNELNREHHPIGKHHPHHHHKKIDSSSVQGQQQHNRHMKPKKSPDIKHFPKQVEKLDSIFSSISKEDIIQSSDTSSSTTSLCDNDDNDDDSLYECSSLNFYYSDSIDDSCDNWPNIVEDASGSSKQTSENVNLILEQIASYSSTTAAATSNDAESAINKIDDNIILVDTKEDCNYIDDNVGEQQTPLELEVTKLPETQIVTCDVNEDVEYHENEDQLDNVDLKEEDSSDAKFDYKEIEKWREKYMSSPLERSTPENQPIEEIELAANIKADRQQSSAQETQKEYETCKNCRENEKILDKYAKEFATKPPDSCFSPVEKTFNKLTSPEEFATSCRPNSRELNEDLSATFAICKSDDAVQECTNIGEEGVTNEVFDNMFQNKFSQFAKYAVKDYLQGIHYTKSSFEEDGEPKIETKSYYDVFKIIEENSKVLDSLSKKTNSILNEVSPAESSDNIQLDSEKSDDRTKTSSSTKDDDLNDSLSDTKTIRENQADLPTADDISSPECNSTSLKADSAEFSDKSYIKLKIDDADGEVVSLDSKANHEMRLDSILSSEKIDRNYLSDKKYFQNNRMSRSFEDHSEPGNEEELKQKTSKSLEYLEIKSETSSAGTKPKYLEEDFQHPVRLSSFDNKSDDSLFCEARLPADTDSAESFKLAVSERPYDDLKEKSIKTIEMYSSYEKKSSAFDNPQQSDPKPHSDRDKNILHDSDHENENGLESKRFKRFEAKEVNNSYDENWFIEKPDVIAKRRNSLRKTASPIEAFKDSATLNYSKLTTEKLSPSRAEKDDDIMSKIRLKALDDPEPPKTKSSLTSAIKSSDKMLHPSTKSVRIYESPRAEQPTSKYNEKYDEYKNEAQYKSYDDDYSTNAVSKYKSSDIDTILNRYGSTTSSKDDAEFATDKSKPTGSSMPYEIKAYDGKYLLRNDESEFKERLESIKNTIKFIDDLCDENDKVKLRNHRSDPNARKSLIFDDLLSKPTPTTTNTTHQSDNRSNTTFTTTLYSSEQCSNRNNSYKYDDYPEYSSNCSATTIGARKSFKRTNSFETLNNIQSDSQQSSADSKSMYSSSTMYKSCIYDDSKTNDIRFESIEKKKSKSYSNIYI